NLPSSSLSVLPHRSLFLPPALCFFLIPSHPSPRHFVHVLLPTPLPSSTASFSHCFLFLLSRPVPSRPALFISPASLHSKLHLNHSLLSSYCSSSTLARAHQLATCCRIACLSSTLHEKEAESSH
ncbi:unnamed protein product, partial [Closterium sp. NIES-54]